MSQKNIWDENYVLDFELIGIVCPMKEYKVGWNLNQLEIFHLVKEDDVKIEFANKKIVRISNLADETDFSSVHLLRNKLLVSSVQGNQYLLPDIKQFDYLLKIKNIIDSNWAKYILEEIKNCKAINYAVNIDIEKIRAKENLIF